MLLTLRYDINTVFKWIISFLGFEEQKGTVRQLLITNGYLVNGPVLGKPHLKVKSEKIYILSVVRGVATLNQCQSLGLLRLRQRATDDKTAPEATDFSLKYL